MNNIPANCIYDSATNSFVQAESYIDETGQLVAPPGYSFVTAEVQSAPAFQASPMVLGFGNPGCMNFASPSPAMGYGGGYGQPSNMAYGGGYPNPARYQKYNGYRPRPGNKARLVENVFNTIKSFTEHQNVYVDVRQENEGYHTVRVHLKKEPDILTAPMIVQKIISEIGVVELSMHFLKKAVTGIKNGLTIYLRLRANTADVQKAINEFASCKISARVVRPMPECMKVAPEVQAPQRKTTSRSLLNISKSKIFKSNAQKPKSSSVMILVKSEKRSPSQKPRRPKQIVVVGDPKMDSHRRETEDEDPDLDDLSESMPTQTIRKPNAKKSKSRTISVLVPRERSKTRLRLKFGNGFTKEITVDN